MPDENHPTDILFLRVTDPEARLKDCPASTTLLYRVCGNGPAKFEEATRLISLFMKAAYDLGAQTHNKE